MKNEFYLAIVQSRKNIKTSFICESYPLLLLAIGLGVGGQVSWWGLSELPALVIYYSARAHMTFQQTLKT
jgi:hypothetical protein